MFKKFVPSCFVVAAAFVFANTNVALAEDAVVPATAPVAVTVDTDCNCVHQKIVRTPIRIHRIHKLRFHEYVAPCEVVVPVEEVSSVPLVPVFAYRKVLCGYHPTTVWVEEGTEGGYITTVDKCGTRYTCDDFEPFEAYKKVLFGFHPTTAYKKVSE